MKKKTILPISRGEFRAITITSLAICLGVILPPHLAGLISSSAQTRIEITEFEPDKSGSDTESTNIAVSGDRSSDVPHPDLSRQTRARPSNTYANKRQRIKTSIPGCRSFDPNTISEDSLVSWGWAPYVLRNMLKYRNNGGKFRQPADLQRVYGMDSTMYSKIESCIEIINARVEPLFVNIADTTQWKALPGIGPVLSARIVKFREKLGGFSNIDQVADTYGLPLETFEIIRPNLRMQTGPKTLNIKTATEMELASHPYISQKQARAMINYFKQNGRPKSLDDLSSLYIADSVWLERISPYLTIDEKTIN